jgi:hypothetical protein
VNEIFTLYDNKYYEANFTHLAELLKRHEGIKVSKTFLRELFLKNYILSPLATRKIRASLKKRIEIKTTSVPQTKGRVEKMFAT